ncbi:MAG: NAD(P)H-hydrate epimerase [Candidatus Omnitrophica bacterium]|nr:NAD(P)H-hydrate epimerase [Candidatus Omnitrophota bacterium]
MKSVTTKQIQKLDEVAIKTFGIPSVVLMENAGRAVFTELGKPGKLPRVAVLCGTGNNAGDGFVVARHLVNAGVRTDVIMLGAATALKADALLNYQLYRRLRCPVHAVKRVTSKTVAMISAAPVTVDAIFGVGLNRAVVGIYREAIEAVNQHAGRVVAVDVPSGLDATSGAIYGVCIKADKTVTFTYPKRGFFVGEGPRVAGKVIVADIGIPNLVKARVIK